MGFFTDEEMEVIAFYDRSGHKEDLIRELKMMRRQLSVRERHMRRLSAAVLFKLQHMDEQDYRALDVLPYIDHLNEGDTV